MAKRKPPTKARAKVKRSRRGGDIASLHVAVVGGTKAPQRLTEKPDAALVLSRVMPALARVVGGTRSDERGVVWRSRLDFKHPRLALSLGATLDRALEQGYFDDVATPGVRVHIGFVTVDGVYLPATRALPTLAESVASTAESLLSNLKKYRETETPGARVRETDGDD